MAFHDPLSIDVGAGAISLPRVISGANTSTYTNGDGTASVSAASTYAKRTRRVLRLDLNKITADPFIPAQNTKVSMSTYVVFDLPVAGYSPAVVASAYIGLNGLMAADSYKILTQLLGGES
jgi:hypothetical protein